MPYTPFRFDNVGMIAKGATVFLVVFPNSVDQGAVFAQALPLDPLSELDTDRQSIFKQLPDLTYSIRVICDPTGSSTRFSIVGAILS
jgi:hypothetical protein